MRTTDGRPVNYQEDGPPDDHSIRKMVIDNERYEITDIYAPRYLRGRPTHTAGGGSVLELDQVYLGDCLELMREMPNACVDTIVTDPPFFIPAEHYQSRKDWGGKRYSDVSVLRIFWESIVTEAVRILKPTGHLFTFCNCDSYPAFYVPLYDQFHKTKSLVWDKTRVGLGHIFRHQHELVIWARHRESVYINDRKLRSDVLSFPATLSSDRDHPVEKPEALLMELIAPTTPLDGVVFDPFAGSGTTLSAARKMGRHYIGVELDPEWHKVAERRVNAANEQGDLFSFSEEVSA